MTSTEPPGARPPAASSTLPPPPAPIPSPTRPANAPKGRPKFGYVIFAVIGLRGFREVAERFAFSKWGFLGLFGVIVAAVGIVLLWRLEQRRRARRRGGKEITPEDVRKQLTDSGLLPPAFPEDGTIEGASILVLDQLPKVLEIETAYDLFGSDAQPLGHVKQIGQSRAKQAFRVLTAFDQFFTHHFEMEDLEGNDVLRLTRPTKIFVSRVHVFDGQDRFLGTIKQQNVFWKIRFQLLDPAGRVVGHLRAKNVRGVGLPRRRPPRARGGHDREVVGGVGPDGVDPSGPVRPPDPRAAPLRDAAARARHAAGDRRLPQAGRPRPRLRFSRRGGGRR